MTTTHPDTTIEIREVTEEEVFLITGGADDGHYCHIFDKNSKRLCQTKGSKMWGRQIDEIREAGEDPAKPCFECGRRRCPDCVAALWSSSHP